MIDTVRVAHPLDASQFMTINASDYDADTHTLWKVQAPGFRGVPEKPAPKEIDPAVRDLAAKLMCKLADHESEGSTRPRFSTLSPEQQLAFLREKDDEFERHLKDRAQDRANREKADRETAQAEQLAKTKAAVAAKDAEVAAQQAAERANDAAQALGATDDGKAPDAPAQQDTGATQAPWAKAPETQPPADEALTVSQGPGRKWFVMKGTNPVTEGMATKAEAEAKRTELAG